MHSVNGVSIGVCGLLCNILSLSSVPTSYISYHSRGKYIMLLYMFNLQLLPRGACSVLENFLWGFSSNSKELH